MILQLASHHFNFISYDLVVLIELIRGGCAFALAFLFWAEPMNCGGKNKLLHRLLAFYMLIIGWYVLDRAFIRLEHIQLGLIIPSSGLLLSEVIITLTMIGLVFKMGADYYKNKIYNKINPPKKRRKCDLTCQSHFTIGDKND